MGEGTGSAATHASLPHCCCAARSCVVANPPSLFAPRTWGRCVSRGRSVSERAQKRDQVAGFLPPSPLEGEQKTKPSCSLEELHLVQLFIFVCKKCV